MCHNFSGSTKCINRREASAPFNHGGSLRNRTYFSPFTKDSRGWSPLPCVHQFVEASQEAHFEGKPVSVLPAVWFAIHVFVDSFSCTCRHTTFHAFVQIGPAILLPQFIKFPFFFSSISKQTKCECTLSLRSGQSHRKWPLWDPWLLLVENYSNIRVIASWNILGWPIFVSSFGGN